MVTGKEKKNIISDIFKETAYLVCSIAFVGQYFYILMLSFGPAKEVL